MCHYINCHRWQKATRLYYKLNLMFKLKNMGFNDGLRSADDGVQTKVKMYRKVFNSDRNSHQRILLPHITKEIITSY